MANIHTLADLNDDDTEMPNTRTMPNAFSRGNAGGDNMTATLYPGDTDDTSPEATKKILGEDTKDFTSCPFWSYNIPGGRPGKFHEILMMYFCCPCFVGSPCTKSRKRDYLAFLYNSCFWLFVLDSIYLIVEMAFGLNPIDIFGLFYNPSWGANNSIILLKLGAKNGHLIQIGHVYRLIVPIFMHSGLFHYFFNMSVQLSFGMGYERYWKPWRMLPIYFISGIFGNLLSCVCKPSGVSVGASGAILGFLFAMIPYIACAWKRLPNYSKLNFIIQMGMVIFMAIMMSFSENVDWSAHLGGAIMGIVIGFIAFANFIPNVIVRWIVICVASLVAFGLFLLFFLVFYLAIETEPFYPPN